MAVLGLPDSRRGGAARVDRHGQLDADAGVVGIALQRADRAGRTTGARIAEGKLAIARHVPVSVRHDQVHAGIVAATLQADVVARDFRRDPARAQLQVLVHGLLDPFLFVGRIRRGQRHVLARAVERVKGVARQFPQELQLRGEAALGLNEGGRRGIVGGLGFLDIGDRDQAHFKALLGLLELAAERVVGRLGGGQRVLRRQHVEVALRRAQDQVLLGGLIVDFRLRNLLVGALQRDPVLPAEDALAERDIPAVRLRVDFRVSDEGHDVAGVGHVAEGARSVALALVVARARAELRQQRGKRLGLGLQRRKPVGLGLADLGIVLQGAGVNLREVAGLHRSGRE